MTLKPFCALLAAIAVTILALPPVQAATPSPTLTVHLSAGGSLTVSQSDTAGGPVITLASTQALPAEIDSLVPGKGDRKKLAVSADPAVPYRNFMNVMNDAKNAGFDELGILDPENKEPPGHLSELVIGLSHGVEFDPTNMALFSKVLFVSVGGDGKVLLSLGIGPEAMRMDASVAGAPDMAAGMVPKDRAKKLAYLRADFEVPVGSALGMLRALRAIGFTKITIIGEATE